MTQLHLGPVGAVLNLTADNLLDAAAAIDDLGYPTIWLTGGPLQSLDQVADVVRATRTAKIGTAILSVDRFPAADVDALYRQLDGEHPGRFVVGLGGAHTGRPIPTLTAYLDALVSVPREVVVLAALGPKMLDLARERAGGALPVLGTPAYTAAARAALGADTQLAMMDIGVLNADRAAAIATGRDQIRFLAGLPTYQAHLHRMGFDDDEIATLSDRLIESIVAVGDTDAIVERIAAQHKAGADHVALTLTTTSPPAVPVHDFRQVATALRL